MSAFVLFRKAFYADACKKNAVMFTLKYHFMLICTRSQFTDSQILSSYDDIITTVHII